MLLRLHLGRAALDPHSATSALSAAGAPPDASADSWRWALQLLERMAEHGLQQNEAGEVGAKRAVVSSSFFLPDLKRGFCLWLMWEGSVWASFGFWFYGFLAILRQSLVQSLVGGLRSLTPGSCRG